MTMKITVRVRSALIPTGQHQWLTNCGVERDSGGKLGRVAELVTPHQFIGKNFRRFYMISLFQGLCGMLGSESLRP